MEENEGILAAARTLGEKIIQLENELRYERIRNDTLSKNNETLIDRNNKLEAKILEVKAYIAEHDRKAE